jgi:hypothetical protein
MRAINHAGAAYWPRAKPGGGRSTTTRAEDAGGGLVLGAAAGMGGLIALSRSPAIAAFNAMFGSARGRDLEKTPGILRYSKGLANAASS